MTRIEDFLAKRIKITFTEKGIISFLYFGSNAFDINNHKFSDYDFLLLLDKYSNSDLPDLRKILSLKIFKNLDINLNIVYKSDLEKRGFHNFQLRSLRPDFYKYLECAIPLIGNNYFEENVLQISKSKLVEYADFKIQEYYGRCDKLFLSEKTTDGLKRKIRKYTNEMLRMLLVRESLISLKEIQSKTYDELYKLAIDSKYIDKNTHQLIKSNNLSNIEKARRTIYMVHLRLYKANTKANN